MKNKLSILILACLTFQACGVKESALEETQIQKEEGVPKAQMVEAVVEDSGAYDFTLCFAGDINFDENWTTTQYLNTCENGIKDCISPELINTMQQADIMWINNEFTYSDRGEPLPGKAYTFRANPDRVENLKELGVDIVGLANNHVYDYGAENIPQN